MLVSSLISSVRYKVGDVPNTKFTDVRIIELINEGLDDFARKVNINKGELVLPIVPYQRKLVIPDPDFVKLLRVRCNNRPVDVKSFSSMDKLPEWEEEVGTQLKSVVYNLNNPRDLTLYPLLEEPVYTNYRQLNNFISSDGTYGIAIDIPGITRDNLDGIITGLKVDNNLQIIYIPNGMQPNGTMTSMADGFNLLDIKYVKRPKAVVNKSDTIDLDDMFKTALVYYISGMLLLDDTRGENINKGMLFINKYKTELENIQEHEKNSFQDIATHVVHYRTGFGDEYGI
jgi:hypothetical protein|nr:MAG TPA: head to tail adaptor [Caudoviricetes sp.]